MPGFAIVGTEPNPGPSHKKNYLRTHRWRIVDIGLPGASSATGNSIPGFFAKSVQLPSLSFEEEKIAGGATNFYKIAKRALWDNVTITFYDVDSLYKTYKKWQDLIWTQKEGIKKAFDYKGDAVFQLNDENGEAVQTYFLRNAYPSSITHGELSYAVNDIKLLSVTYSYDHAEIKFADFPPDLDQVSLESGIISELAIPGGPSLFPIGEFGALI